MTYDPDLTPDPNAWLGLDEDERMSAVRQAFETRGETPPHMRVAIQAVIETQIAAQDPPATGRAAERLEAEGLRRSMVMRVLTLELIAHMQKAMAAGAFDHDAYAERLDGLTAAGILAEGLGRWGLE